MGVGVIVFLFVVAYSLARKIERQEEQIADIRELFDSSGDDND